MVFLGSNWWVKDPPPDMARSERGAGNWLGPHGTSSAICWDIRKGGAGMNSDFRALNNPGTNLNELYAVTIADDQERRRVIGRFQSRAKADRLSMAYDQVMAPRVFVQRSRFVWEQVSGPESAE